MARIKRLDLWLGFVVGLALITASWRQWAPYSLTETLGFVTGAACVYLVVRQSIWNFPLGIANNIFFLVLYRGRHHYHGHKYLIDFAIAHVDKLNLIICQKPGEAPPGELRAAWLREIHPNVRVLLIDDVYDEQDSRVWAENSIRWLGFVPDVVFTSEDYIDAIPEKRA